jgi:hypothetical protein
VSNYHEKTHTKFEVLCVRHGHRGDALLTDDQLSGKVKVTCPKCSLEAVPMNITGLLRAIPRMALEVASMRNELFEIHCLIESQDSLSLAVLKETESAVIKEIESRKRRGLSR